MIKVHTRLKVMLFCAASLAALPLATVCPASAAPTYKQIPLDGGGYFSGLAIHRSGRLYGYGDVFGAFRWDQASERWTYLQGDIKTWDDFVSGIAVANNDANGDIVAFRSGSKLFTSSNGGITWTPRLTDLTNIRLVRAASPVMYHPANDLDLWMAGNRTGQSSGLWRSPDGGASWNPVGGTFFDNMKVTTFYVHPNFPDQVWVGAQGGLYVSTNRGSSWTHVWNNDGLNNPWNDALPEAHAIVRRNDGIGYIATNVGGYRVTASDWNNPATYTFTKTVSYWGGWGPANATVLADGRFVTGGVYGERNPSNPSDLRDAQRISSDGGQNWTYVPMNLLPEPRPVWSPPIAAGDKTGYGRDMIVQDPTTPNRLFMTGGFAPFVSNDWGQTWKYIAKGTAGVMTYKVNFPRNNPNMALIPGGDLCAFVVTDGGASGDAQQSSHRTIPKLMSSHEIMSSDNGQLLIAAGTDQGANKSMIMRSTDSGASWVEQNLTNSGLPSSTEGIVRSAMNPNNFDDFLVVLGYAPDLGVVVEGGATTPLVWRTLNGGQSFSPVVGLPTGVNTGHRYFPNSSQLLVDGQNPNIRYFSIGKALELYRSTNNGANWSKMAQPWSNAWVQDIAVDPSVEGKLWAAGAWAGVLTSDDGGASWYHVGSSWPVSGFTQAKLVDAANGQVAVFGQRAGDTWDKIYWSPDNGLTWSEATGEGHRYAFTKGLAVDPYVRGKLWVSGISVNVISGLPGSLTAPDNTPPTVDSFFAGSILKTQTKTITLTDVNAQDADGDALQFVLPSTSTSKGTMTLNQSATAIIYTPKANRSGQDSFTFKVTDGESETQQSITINIQNRTPVANSNSNITLVPGEKTLVDVLANDSDPDSDTFKVISASSTASGLTLDFSTGQLFVTASATTPSDAVINYTIEDSDLDNALTGSSTATIAVAVEPTNHAPVASAGADRTVSLDGLTASVTLNGSSSSDEDGDTLTYIWKKGSETIGTGVSPHVNLAQGVHNITLTVSDPSMASSTDTVVISVQMPLATPRKIIFGSGLIKVNGGIVQADFMSLSNLFGWGKLWGTVNFRDSRNGGYSLRGTSLQSAVVSGTNGKIFGTGTATVGRTTRRVTFVIQGNDLFTPRPNRGDTMSLEVSDGYTFNAAYNKGDVKIISW